MRTRTAPAIQNVPRSRYSAASSCSRSHRIGKVTVPGDLTRNISHCIEFEWEDRPCPRGVTQKRHHGSI